MSRNAVISGNPADAPSKAETLRGIVTERLSAASREILTALNAVVAAFEQEASGFREEIHRQKRQLELLQPQVSGGTAAAGPKVSTRCSPAEEEDDEEKDGKRVKSLESSALLRFSSPQCQKAQRKPRRPQIQKIQNTTDLSVHVLQDSQRDTLSKNVMKKCPAVKLKCPRGLLETDFLDLLRSSVPQLSGHNKPLEIFTWDKRRRLKPLKLKMVTLDEIHKTLCCSGLGKAAVHIWIKTQEEPRKDICPLERPNSNSAMLTCEKTSEPTSSRLDNVVIRSSSQQEEGGEEGMETGGQDQGTLGPNDGPEDVLGGEDKEDVGNDSWKPDERLKDNSELQSKTSDEQDNHQKPVHKCYTCHQVFHQEEQLRAHHGSHTKGKTYLCGICGKFLSNNRSLTRHKKTHSVDRPHRCQICGRGFKLPTTLKQHEKIHTDRERSYLCDVCCKMFLTAKQLAIHMRTHTNEKPFHCDECGKGFTTKGPLTIHMRVHTGETPYRCPYCGWSFKRKTHLDNHVAVHTGARPYVCAICGKTCARKTYLTVHMRTHNGERPYRCSVCDKAFTQSHCLKTHMRSHQAAAAPTPV